MKENYKGQNEQPSAEDSTFLAVVFGLIFSTVIILGIVIMLIIIS